MKTIKSKIFTSLIFCAVFSTSVSSQTTLTLQPLAADAKDAEIWSLAATTNYGTWPEIKANAWTWSGVSGYQRGLFQFDLSSIPVGATIVSAKLSLYAFDSPYSQFHSGDNDSWLKKITSTWDESTVTWATQPSTTDVNEVSLHESASGYENYLDIDVKPIVEEMVIDPTHNYGFMMQLQTEIKFRRLTFASSDQSDVAKNPKLVIVYTVESSEGCITLQPGAADGNDAELWNLESATNYGTWPEIKANAWTWSGNEGKQRALFNFDLTSIPEGAIIDDATLSLYSIGSPSDQFHSGLNKSVLKRVTSSWDESTVTWATQPSTTTLNQKVLPMSTSPYQDYTTINVINLVNDMVADPENSYGFELKLAKEKKYRRMTFASSDNADSTKNPKLEICYHMDTAGKFAAPVNAGMKVFPNPFDNAIQISLSSYNETYPVIVKVYDMSGNIVKELAYETNNFIVNLDDMQSQSLIVNVMNGNNIFREVIIKN